MVRMVLRVLLLTAIAGLTLWIGSWLYEHTVDAGTSADGDPAPAFPAGAPAESGATASAPALYAADAVVEKQAENKAKTAFEPEVEAALLVAPIEASAPIASAAGSLPVELAAALRCAPPDVIESGLAAHGETLDEASADLLRGCAAAFGGRMEEARSAARSLAKRAGVDPRDRAALEAVLASGDQALAERVAETPIERAIAIRTGDARARSAAAHADMPAAVRELSRLVLLELGAPWPASRELLARWSQGLTAAQESVRWNPQADWPSVEVVVAAGDSISRIRQRVCAENPGMRVCTGMIERSNRLNRPIQPGMRLRIPTDEVAIVVDLDARWLVLSMGGEVAGAWEVAIGRAGRETPRGQYQIGELQTEPMWFPAGQPPVSFGDPKNPLGTRWIGWTRSDGTNTGLGIHGTNEPETIGSAASDGCVRMRNEDVERLYVLVPRGAPVTVR